MITLESPRNTAVHASLDARAGRVAAGDGWVQWGLSRAGLARFAKRAQAAVGVTGEVDVLLAGDATLRRLNRTFRSRDKATDVLSFPAHAECGGGHAGDLAISLETAKRQAEQHGHSLRDEVCVLLLHGLLHLAGMDHEADDGKMAEREAELRGVLGLPVGLIERVGSGRRRFPSGMTNRKARATAKAFNAVNAKGEREDREVKRAKVSRSARRKVAA